MSGWLQDDQRGWFDRDFDFARAFRLFLFAWPRFVIEMKGRSSPNNSYLTELSNGQRKFVLFFRQPRSEMLHEKRAIGFARANELELTIFHCSVRGEIQGGAD